MDLILIPEIRYNQKKIIKNGSIHNGTQKYACKICSRQFVENPRNTPVSHEKIDLTEKLLPEKLSLAGISRVSGASEMYIQQYVNKKTGYPLDASSYIM